MKIPFVKYHGAGNDFILIDDRQMTFPLSSHDLIASLCRRSTGVGADGIILLQPSSQADFQMRIFNADGSEPAMCGNGLRCLVDWAHQLGWNQSIYSVETQAGVLRCFIQKQKIGIELGHPRVLFHKTQVDVDGHAFELEVIDTGVPHGVIFVEELKDVEILDVARAIRFHSQFSPGGVNVNFAQVLPDRSLLVRTYERGVEGETISCGTGAAAAGWLALQMQKGAGSIKVRNLQGIHLLEVSSCPQAGVTLWGQATFVFQGVVESEAFCHA